MNKKQIDEFEKEQKQIKEKMEKGEIKSVKCPVCLGKGLIKSWKGEIRDCGYCEGVGSILIETNIKENQIYDVNYTSALLGYNKQNLLRKIRKGEIKAKKVGKKYLILGKNILEFLNS